ncbi:PucR family transcriptional regulator [Caloranaerobacter ferrireducens]|uniref:PucR family transcriptional regulator n=1 Tax=Caloranaerobacter ferrireducens TaxID=1323370 RepID=UPI00084D9BE7|nr:PucR family transcriptional regulator [Caloranaerobacter ferrireducens]
MVRQNGILLEDILKMDCMKNCKLIAGYKGIKNTVSRVNIMADPDILDWVHEGELLLTTAYSFRKESVIEQKEFIKQCSEKKLAGIGIKIYPYIKSLSKEVIELADKLNFPIIDLYYATPFSDIMTPIFKEIFNKQASLLQRLEKIHEKLMNAMMGNFSIEKITEVVYESVRNPVLVDLEFPKKTIIKFDCEDDKTKNLLLKNLKKFYKESLSKYKDNKLYESTELIKGKYIKRMVMPIIVKNHLYGYIFTWSTSTPLGGFDFSVLESASTTIALEILKILSVMEVENRHKYEFIEDLISLDNKRREKALERAVLFKLNRDNKYVMAVICINRSTNTENAALSDDSFQKKIIRLANSIEKLIGDININGLVTNKTDSIYVLLSFNDNEKMDLKLEIFSNKVEKLLRKSLGKFKFRMGIGREYIGLMNAYKSYMDTIKAIRAGGILDENCVVNFEDLGIYKILCHDSLKEELIKFYNTTIKCLVEYDIKKSTDLVKTLEAYFEYNGNLKKMSQALFTHYNTILYRIQRIKDITGMDLENAKDRLNLEVALKIKKILQSEE